MAAKPGPQRVKKQPQRTCVACREVVGKRTLLRLVRTPEGRVELDPTGKKSGRGAYVHDSAECIDRTLATGALNRALRVQPDQELARELRERAVAGGTADTNS